MHAALPHTKVAMFIYRQSEYRAVRLLHAANGLSVPTKWAIWGFVALLGGGYLWAAPAKQALTPHLSHFIPLLSLAEGKQILSVVIVNFE